MSATAQALASATPAQRGSLKRSRRWALIWSYIFLAIFAIFFLMPPVYMLIMGLKGSGEIAAMTNPWWVYHPTLENFKALLTSPQYLTFFRNSAVISVVVVIFRSSRPHLSSLGRVPGAPGTYTDLTRHPENVPVTGVLILRLDGPMYYANALTVRDRIKVLIAEAEPLPRAVILDAAAQDEIDVTSTDTLKSLIKELHDSNIAVYVADLHLPIREYSRRTGLLELVGEDKIFPTVDAAVRSIEKTSHETT